MVIEVAVLLHVLALLCCCKWCSAGYELGTHRARWAGYCVNGRAKVGGIEDIAFLVVLGGLGQMAKLCAGSTYNERRRDLQAYITHLSPHTSECWRRHGRKIGVFSPALLDDVPCARIGYHAARSDLGAADGTDDGTLTTTTSVNRDVGSGAGLTDDGRMMGRHSWCRVVEGS